MALENLKSVYNDLTLNSTIKSVNETARQLKLDEAVKLTEDLISGRFSTNNPSLTDLANPVLKNIDYSLRATVGLPFNNLGDNPPDEIEKAVDAALTARYEISKPKNPVLGYIVDEANRAIDTAKVRVIQELVEAAQVPVVGRPTPFIDLGRGPGETNYIDLVSLQPVVESPSDDQIAPRKKGDFYVRIKDMRDNNHIYFRGYITGITENVSPSFSPVNYIGRSEPVYVYERGERDISFNLKVYPANFTEQRLMYDKLNKLTSLAYPEYLPDSNGLVRMKPPFTELYMAHIGKRNKGKFGFLKSITYTVNEQGDWDALRALPRYFDIAISYQILSKKPPSLGDDFYSEYDKTLERGY